MDIEELVLFNLEGSGDLKAGEIIELELDAEVIARVEVRDNGVGEFYLERLDNYE